MRRRQLLRFAVWLALIFWAGLPLYGNPVRLFNSGVGTNGVVLAEGSIDPHITILNRTDGLAGTTAYVVADGAWLPNDANSAWICAESNRFDAHDAQWTFRVPIDLTGCDLSNLVLLAQVSCDNYIRATRLNSQDLNFLAAGYESWTLLPLTDGLVAGMNYLDLDLQDVGSISGFRIEFRVSQPPNLSIENTAVDEGDIGEITNAMFQLTLDRPADQPIKVDFDTLDITATSGADYVRTSGSVVFDVGTDTTFITVPVIGDKIIEPAETFKLVITNVTHGVKIKTREAIGTIRDNDTPLVSIDDVVVTEAPGGSTNAVFTVRLNTFSAQTVRMSFSTQNGTAIAPGDYVSTNGILTFFPGVRTQFVSVAVLGDLLFNEPTEDFQVILENVTNALCAKCVATGTILNVNDNIPEIRVQDAEVFEGSIGETNLLVFTFTLSFPSDLPVSVDYQTVNGTTNAAATAGSDYEPVSGTLTFLPGQTTTNVIVKVFGDNEPEFDEFLYLRLGNPINAKVPRTEIAGLILEDDAPCLFISNPIVKEGEMAIFTVDFRQPASATVTNLLTVKYSTSNGTAIAGMDYIPQSGTFSFSNLFLHTNIVVPINNDLELESNETFSVTVDFSQVLCRGPGVCTIIDATIPPIISINNSAVVEGNSGTTNMLFTATLSRASPQTISLDYSTADGTAFAGSDYLARSGTLTFPPQTTNLVFAVPVIGDLASEPDETFFVQLSNPRYALVATNVVIGTILNDDANDTLSVSITSPVDGAIFYTPPGLIPIVAEAHSSGSPVQRVRFYAGNNYLGAADQVPYGYQWTNSLPGDYVLTAVALSESALSATSAPVHIQVVTCSGTFSATPLSNQTACVCEVAVFSTVVSSPAPVSFVWRANGRMIPGQTSSNLVLQSLKDADAGTYSVEISNPCKRLTNTATLVVEGGHLPNPLVLSNSSRVQINESAAATPYPSVINVKCVPGTVKKVTASVYGLSHTSSHDIDMLLGSPRNKGLKLMSDAGLSVSNANLVFSDNAALSVPAFPNVIRSGTYRPTDYGPDGDDDFPTSIALVTNFAGFSGVSPNGNWGLYVQDDEPLDLGEIARGWSLTIDWEDSAPRLLFPSSQSDGLFQMALLSQPGQTHVIEASTDLRQWAPFGTNTMTGTNMLLTFPDANVFPRRFFRVVRCPILDLFNVELPPRLLSPRRVGPDTFQVTLSGTPGRSYAIEVSSDLRQWNSVSTYQIIDTDLPVVLPGIGLATNLFYRAVSVP